MLWRNQPTHWGLAAVLMHWVVAIAVFGLFGSGLWMTDLHLYHAWYTQAPFLHKSFGLALFAVVLIRLLWRSLDRAPKHHPNHALWEQRLSMLVHTLLYGLLLLMCISGYLISTAAGRSISVFGWVEAPALISHMDGQADIAGVIHWYAACTLISCVGLHAVAAIKHQLIDKDGTLTRMLGSQLLNK